MGGALIPEEQALLRELGSALQIADDEYAQFEQRATIEAYTDAVRTAWQNGFLSRHSVERLGRLRNDLNISAEQHLTIEQNIREELAERLTD